VIPTDAAGSSLRTITTPMPATADPSSAPQPTATYINGLDPDEVTRFAEMGLLLDRHKSPPFGQLIPATVPSSLVHDATQRNG